LEPETYQHPHFYRPDALPSHTQKYDTHTHAHNTCTRTRTHTSDILVLKLISVLVFILFSSQNFYFI